MPPRFTTQVSHSCWLPSFPPSADSTALSAAMTRSLPQLASHWFSFTQHHEFRLSLLIIGSFRRSIDIAYFITLLAGGDYHAQEAIPLFRRDVRLAISFDAAEQPILRLWRSAWRFAAADLVIRSLLVISALSAIFARRLAHTRFLAIAAEFLDDYAVTAR